MILFVIGNSENIREKILKKKTKREGNEKVRILDVRMFLSMLKENHSRMANFSVNGVQRKLIKHTLTQFQNKTGFDKLISMEFLSRRLPAGSIKILSLNIDEIWKSNAPFRVFGPSSFQPNEKKGSRS